MALYQGIAVSVFCSCRCKGNAAITHGNVFCQLNFQCVIFFDDADVIGSRKFTGSAEDIECSTIELRNRAIFGRIVTGELQVYFTVFTNNVVSRGNLIDFKLFIVVSGNGQLIAIQASSGNVLILQAANFNGTSVLHG